MKMPWRAAEAMHWQLGEEEMTRRAGVNPFSLSIRQRRHGRNIDTAPEAWIEVHQLSQGMPLTMKKVVQNHQR